MMDEELLEDVRTLLKRFRPAPGSSLGGAVRPLALVAVMLGATGCGAVNGALQERVAHEAAGLSPAVDDDEEVARTARAAAEGGAAPPSAEPLRAEPTLERYVAIALRESPAIHRAIREVQLLGWQVPQVTSLEDPMLELIPPTGDMTETAGGMMGGMVSVSQKIPFPGKLGTRGRVVEQSVRMALQDLADTRIATVAEVQKAYYRHYLADVSIQLTRESERLLRQIRDVATARYTAGMTTQQDVLRAEVELYNLTNDVITLEQQSATAQARLNSLMNRQVDAPLPPPRPFDLAAVEWRLPEAMARAVASSPRLVRLQERIGRDLEQIKLARLDYLPDLTAGFNRTFIDAEGLSPVATGADVWNLAFGINLPIWWQRLRAQVLEANAGALASVAAYEELRNTVAFELQDTLVKIDTQYRLAVLFQRLIIPRAWQAVEVTTAAYQAGTVEFTALVDNWRNWFDAVLAYHRALAGLEQRFADLQQQVGIRLPRRAADLEAATATTAGVRPIDPVHAGTRAGKAEAPAGGPKEH